MCPDAVTMPLVIVGVGIGVYAVRDTGMDDSMRVLGLLARAYAVYFQTLPAFPR